MRKAQNYQWKELSLGTCYYPEHWDRNLWKEDLDRMLANGIHTIRIGEFAWSKVEPREGEFTFAFFDDFLEVVAQTEMKVIFGTPTATPPAWLTDKYPEVLNCRMDGVKYRHGMRRHYNYNSKVYRELSAKIVEKFGEHYAPHKNVVGWQIDNEINCEVAEFYSESDTLAFREFLKKKYGTLEELNKAWGAVFWNQEYTQWEQVYVPRTTIHNSTNPHETLDYIRFVSDSAISFCKMQSDILRKYIKPGDFITTNGMFQNLDNHAMTDEALDVYTYDSYPNFAYCLCEDPKHSKNLNDRRWSDKLTEVRSICPHFGIMEQQSGANGWNTRMEAPAPKPGQMMLWAMQSIGHGADYVSFFRWRTCTMGTEIYWHGILDYDNRDNRKLAEYTLAVPDGPAGQEAVDVRFTYDIDGILLADIRVVSTGHTISSVVSQTVDDERLQARMKELEKLKVHPREVTENKLLLNRLMTLCEESSPKDREYFAGLIALFEKTLEDQDPRKIKRCREQIQKSIANFSDREIFDDFDFWGEIYGGGDDGEEQEEKPEEDLDFMEFSKKWTS